MRRGALVAFAVANPLSYPVDAPALRGGPSDRDRHGDVLGRAPRFADVLDAVDDDVGGDVVEVLLAANARRHEDVPNNLKDGGIVKELFRHGPPGLPRAPKNIDTHPVRPPMLGGWRLRCELRPDPGRRKDKCAHGIRHLGHAHFRQVLLLVPRDIGRERMIVLLGALVLK